MSLKIWLPLTGTLDNLGLSNYTFTAHDATVNANGKLGKCYVFNGNKQWLQFSDNLGDFYNHDWSFAAWLKPTDSTRGIILSEYRGTGASNVAIELLANRNVRLYWNGTPDINFSTAGPVPINVWTHVALTKQGSTFMLYFNGVLKQIYTYSGTLSTRTSACQPRIGDDYSGNTSSDVSYQGYMNDFRLYDHTLSVKEIKELAKGLVMHYKLDGGGLGGENVVRNSTGFEGSTTWNGLVTVGTEGGAPYLIAQRTDTASTSRTFCYVKNGITSLVSGWAAGSSFTISGYYKIPTDAQITVTSYIANMFIRWTLPSGSSDTGFSVGVTEARGVWTRFEKTFTVPSAYAGGASNFYLSAFVQGLSTIYWKNVKMELGPHATAWSPARADANYPSGLDTAVIDCSGYKYNGITNNIVCTGDTPRYTAASVFNGSNSYVKVDSNQWMVQGATEMTINFWAKVASWPASIRILSCTESGGFNIEAGNSGYYRFPVNVYTNAAQTSFAYQYDSTEIKISDLPVNEWCMITCQYTATEGAKTYINGQLHHVRSSGVSYGLHYNTNARLFLGCEANTASPSAPYFNGQMSDFRLYYTALSAEDILELYQTSASVDKSGNVYARELVEV